MQHVMHVRIASTMHVRVVISSRHTMALTFDIIILPASPNRGRHSKGKVNRESPRESCVPPLFDAKNLSHTKIKTRPPFEP